MGSGNEGRRTVGLEIEAVHLRGRVAELERICAAQRDELGKLRGHDGELSEREWRILDMWPRFEDGEPVMPGDETAECGEVSRVCVTYKTAYFNESHRSDLVRHPHGERVKRPAPEGLTQREPDSWKKLFGDATVGPCRYFGRLNEDGTERCEGCPAEQADCCTSKQMEDLIRRAKKLAGIEAE